MNSYRVSPICNGIVVVHDGAQVRKGMLKIIGDRILKIMNKQTKHGPVL
jgi:hypothetical protein